MGRTTVAQFWQDVRRSVIVGRKAALEKGVAVMYQGTLDELARGSPGQGRRYKRGKRRYHRASRAGDAPARDTGRLIRAIGTHVERDGSRGAVGVKRSAPYAKYLDPPKGQPEPAIGRRPFLSSAFEKHEREARQVMAREMERRMRRLTR